MKIRLFHRGASVLLAFGMAGCGGGTAPGKLDQSNSLAGPDANANGVRDDIEAILVNRYKNPQQLAAAMQLARVLQAAVLVDANDTAKAIEIGNRVGRAIRCLSSQFPTKEGQSTDTITRELESLTTNTAARLKAYLAYNRALSGSAFHWPTENTCDYRQ